MMVDFDAGRVGSALSGKLYSTAADSPAMSFEQKVNTDLHFAMSSCGQVDAPPRRIGAL